MKVVSQFVCDHCNTSYSSQKECLECEKTHKKILSITSTRYVSFKQDKTGFPATIEVSFGDGTKAFYKR